MITYIQNLHRFVALRSHVHASVLIALQSISRLHVVRLCLRDMLPVRAESLCNPHYVKKLDFFSSWAALFFPHQIWRLTQKVSKKQSWGLTLNTRGNLSQVKTERLDTCRETTRILWVVQVNVIKEAILQKEPPGKPSLKSKQNAVWVFPRQILQL